MIIRCSHGYGYHQQRVRRGSISYTPQVSEELEVCTIHSIMLSKANDTTQCTDVHCLVTLVVYCTTALTGSQTRHVCLLSRCCRDPQVRMVCFLPKAQRLMEGYSSGRRRSASAPSKGGAEIKSQLPVSLRVAVVRAKVRYVVASGCPR